MKVFKPTPGKGFAWCIGGMIFSALIFAIPVGVNMVGKANLSFLLIMGLTSVLMMAMFGYFTWAARNMEYIITEKELIIKWAFNRKVVPLDGIKGVRRMPGTGAVKVVGASLPGFHIGSFTDPGGKGSVNMFATRLWGEIILLQTRWETIGLTPENPEEFLAALEGAAPHRLASGEELAGEAAEVGFNMWHDKKYLFMLGLNVALLAGAFYWVYTMTQTLPERIPMQQNLAGEITRYGSPKEHYLLPGIGLVVFIFMTIVTATATKNNKTSVYLMGATSLFVNLLFLGILLAIRMAF